MKTLLYIPTLLLSAGLVYSQNTQLVYLKTDQGQQSYFFPDGDSAYFRTFMASATDATLLPGGAPYELTPALGDGRYHVVYDSQLAPAGHIEINSLQISNIRTLKKTNSQYLMYHGGYNNTGFAPISSNPELTGNFPETIGVNFLLEYDADENTLHMPFNCICRNHQAESAIPYRPYNAFPSHIGLYSNNNSSNSAMAWMNDGTVITVLNMFDQITINLEDEYSIGDGYNWGDVWVKIDPTSGLYIATPMLSENGTALTHSVQGSPDGAHLYRTAVLRGQNLQISPDGTQWASSSTEDSLFYAYMVKENAQGDHIWSVPLFSYENAFDTETTAFNLHQFQVDHLVEVNSNHYVELYYRLSMGNEHDSLYFNDYMGDENMYYCPESFEPEPGSNQYVAKSAREVIHFDENGQRISKLVFPLRSPDPWNFYHAGWFFQEPKLFKVNDKLGWPHTYAAIGDTTLYFIRQYPNGMMDSTGVNLPAGRGTFVLWLDESLNIVDYTNFAFSTGSNNMVQGVSIWNIKALNNDTLMIDGRIGNNTTTRLDPEGLADEVTYSPATSYVALYSLPDFLVSEKIRPDSNQRIHLFPNPANDRITLQHQFHRQVSYYIFDMAGREIKNGIIPANQNQTQISIDGFDKGMYFVVVKDGSLSFATSKLVVQ